MAKARASWQVLPHGPLTELADGLWTVDGSLTGMPLPRRMVVARREDGSLVIHNAICLDPEQLAALEAKGPPAVIVVPGAYHRLDARAFTERYPEAKLFCPAGARKRVADVVSVHGTYDDFAADARIRLVHLEGTRSLEGVMEVHADDGVTLVFNDAIFNLPRMSGLFGMVYGKLMGNAGKPKVTTVGRLLLVKDKAAFRAHLERLAETAGLRRVLVAHGDPIGDDAGGVLRTVAGAF